MAGRRSGGDALSKQVYRALADRIISLRLKPYEQLSELSISEELGVSRTPIREAFVRLAELGLVDIFPQRATIVTPLRMPDLERSQFLREALEVALIRRVLERKDRGGLVDKLRAEIMVQKTFAHLGELERFYASDEQFHGQIAIFAGMASIVPEIERAKIHMDRFRHLMISGIENIDQVLDQHVAIVDALEAGKARACEEAIQVHLRRILRYADVAREAFPEYFEGQDAPGGGRRIRTRDSARA